MSNNNNLDDYLSGGLEKMTDNINHMRDKIQSFNDTWNEKQREKVNLSKAPVFKPLYSKSNIKRIEKHTKSKCDSGLTLMIIGGLFFMVSFFDEISYLSFFEAIGESIIWIALLIIGLIIWNKYKPKQKLIEHFYLYCSILEAKYACSIDELSAATGFDGDDIIDDIRNMISENMFQHVYLDVKHHMVFTTKDAYDTFQLPPTPDKTNKKETVVQEEKIEYPEEIKDFIQECNNTIHTMDTYSKTIHNHKVVSQLDYMEIIVTKIIDYVKKHPESIEDTKRMRKYYLPYTIKLLEDYKELEDGHITGDPLEKSKKEIEDVLELINTGFTKLYENMYQDTSMDIHSDISVLKHLMEQDGLTDGHKHQA